MESHSKSPVPRISVLLSTYNDERFLRDSIESILRQTFRDFELIIVDDASTDRTPQIIAELAAKDVRIVPLRNAKSLRLPGSLNRALEVAQGDVVARQDGDDVSHANRLEEQLQFLDDHPDVGVVGTQMRMVDPEGRYVDDYELPLRHSQIIWAIAFGRSLAHPTVALRTALLREVGGYDANARDAEDIELWTRLASRARFANLPLTLFDYRVHPASTSQERRAQQLARVWEVRAAWFSSLLSQNVSPTLLQWLHHAQRRSHELSIEELSQLTGLLLDLHEALVERMLFLPQEMQHVRADLARLLAELGGGLVIEDEKTLVASCRKLLPRPIYYAAMAAAFPRIVVAKSLVPLRTWLRSVS